MSVVMQERTQKGNSIIDFLENYVVVDVETTGLDPKYDDLIEIAAVRVRNGTKSEQFQSLINPGYDIDSFIVELTGITNEMLANAPRLADILPQFAEFLGTDILLGHNINFDVNFLYDAFLSILDKHLTNDFVDTMRISRRLFPNEPHHRLKDLRKKYSVSNAHSHRATADCLATFEIYCRMVEHSHENQITPNSLLPKKIKICAGDLSASTDDFDVGHPLYGKVCVFTGTLNKMVRREAMQLVLDCGGKCADSVTKSTNFLILGNNDYCSSIKDGKSSKQKKAEALVISGAYLQILSEDVFYSLLE